MRIVWKRLAMIACICLLAAFLFSTFYIAEYTHHDCSHDHCEVCLQIVHVSGTLKQLGTVAPLALFAAVVLVGTLFLPDKREPCAINDLITLKIRLNH